ncbi:MAG: methyl-accepting chemotaxis protein [Candidatus Nitrosocaldus sp.]|nr:methyl-accepting chemotaxis protein [Candidatus Nitrosocaldus sp.]MDW8274988.1 methyl-accepting chemotaxis protein [Candidatus Nitrosocaldus sp.]
MVQAQVSRFDVEDDGMAILNGITTNIAQLVKSADKNRIYMDEMLSMMNEQANGIANISTAVNTITNSIQSISIALSDTSNIAGNLAKSSGDSAENARQVLAEIAKINGVVRSFHEANMKVRDEFKAINNIVKFIDRVADRTNLLALNAAIEAARAGEAGRGFAVVAEEVRALAMDTSKNANEIAKMITSISNLFDELSRSISENVEVLNNMVTKVTDILNALQSIADSVKSINENIRQIAVSSQEAAAGSEELTATTEQLKSSTDANMRHVNEISSSLKDMMNTISGISSAASKLRYIVDVFSCIADASIVSMTDIEGDINYVNKKFLSVSRYSKDELYGQNHRILKSGFHDTSLFESMWKTISNGGTFIGYVRNRAKDGSIYWVKAVIKPTYDGNGSIDGYVAVRTPVTELMVSLGVEDAIRLISQGKARKVDVRMREIVEGLRLGTYRIYDNYANGY